MAVYEREASGHLVKEFMDVLQRQLESRGFERRMSVEAPGGPEVTEYANASDRVAVTLYDRGPNRIQMVIDATDDAEPVIRKAVEELVEQVRGFFV